jgi:hypothetical protein
MAVVQNLEVALEIPNQEDPQAQNQGAVEITEVPSLVVVGVVVAAAVVGVAEVDHVFPALQHHLLTPHLHCSSQLQWRRHRHLETLGQILVTIFRLRYVESCWSILLCRFSRL